MNRIEPIIYKCRTFFPIKNYFEENNHFLPLDKLKGMIWFFIVFLYHCENESAGCNSSGGVSYEKFSRMTASSLKI